MVEKNSGVVAVGFSKGNWDDTSCVCVGEWIVGWPREILGYLHLFLNKFRVLCSHGSHLHSESELSRENILPAGWEV